MAILRGRSDRHRLPPKVARDAINLSPLISEAAGKLCGWSPCKNTPRGVRDDPMQVKAVIDANGPLCQPKIANIGCPVGEQVADDDPAPSIACAKTL